MFLGVLIFWLGNRHYKHVDVLKPVQGQRHVASTSILAIVILPAVCWPALARGFLIPGSVFRLRFYRCFPVWFVADRFLLRFVYGPKLLARRIKTRSRRCWPFLAVVIIFWAIFKQNGTALTTWAQYYTNRSLPDAVWKSQLRLLAWCNM
jgi:POT family proton-dependent oligopeptide transporter